MTPKLFLERLGAKRPELISMWSCFAIDPGFRASDFEEFDVDEWRRAASRMLKSTRVPPHLADWNSDSKLGL